MLNGADCKLQHLGHTAWSVLGQKRHEILRPRAQNDARFVSRQSAGIEATVADAMSRARWNGVEGGAS
jgi:hypothetical protein